MIYPFINFDGDCREAVEYYAEVFGTEKPKFQSYGDVPPDPNIPPQSMEANNRVIYTTLKITESIIMFADLPLGEKFIPGNNLSLSMIIEDPLLVQTYFDALKEGGIVLFPLQETFYTKKFGIVTDKYGVTWQIGIGTEEEILNP
ncbi:VOC family protein [Trichococcus sp. K1Tr]|uniref:VOC family protein n=1 Tax=Trichococcus sp. K1Tr TaxID=3020847 RepID=UPI00232CDCF7|nr:VOC family protein [Trichococcus sp. K1Tr]MDB6354246.1 VOC family protein [Trichococcus sp. K1Tr]